MAACTFFGHRECSNTITPILSVVLEDLICSNGVDTFYVGNQGQFDTLVYCVLRDLKKEYQHIRFAVVLAYFPSKGNASCDYSDTLFPEGIEFVHPQYAISWRNRWMLRQSDFVIAYITHTWGGAAKFVEAAERQRKKVIHIESRSLRNLSTPVLERLLQRDLEGKKNAALSEEMILQICDILVNRNRFTHPEQNTDAEKAWLQFQNYYQDSK